MTVHHAAPAPLIGCAGWSIPKEVAAAFPEAGTHLARYGAVMPAVEINSSFYRPHRAQTWARWADSVPAHFRFSVKMPRAITHDAQLRDVDTLVATFAAEVGQLGSKLGCLLMQFPPKMGFHDETVRAFFLRLADTFDCMLACEGRHASWFSEGATDLLRERGVTRVIADPPAGQPGVHVATTPHLYLRLHGAPRIYYSPYGQAQLAALAQQLQAQQEAGQQAWCIFDNTAAGAALPNALDLLHACQGARLG